MGIDPMCGVPIAMPHNRDMLTHTKPALPTSPETSLLPTRQARISYHRGSSFGCRRPLPWPMVWGRSTSTIASKRRRLEQSLNDILAASTSCDFARDIQNKFRRARDQLLTFALWPGRVEATNNACERALRPAVIQRKVTNGYRAMWAAEGEADIRTVVARLAPGANPFKTILQTVSA